VVGATVSDPFPGTFTGVTYTATQTGGATGFTASGSGNLADTATFIDTLIIPVGTPLGTLTITPFGLDSLGDADDQPWTVERLRAAREAYCVEHGGLRLDPEARNLRHTHVEPSPDRGSWRVQQMLIDTNEINDWVMELDVSLAASRAAGGPVLQLLRLGSLA